jgi:hypothetical protein
VSKSTEEWLIEFAERTWKRASEGRQIDVENLRDRDRFLESVKDTALRAEIQQRLSAAVPEEIERLTLVADYYAAQCDNCLAAAAYFPASVMAAAMIESLLLLNAFMERDCVTKHSIFLNRSYQKSTSSVFHLQFNELIALSAVLGWLPAKTIDQELVQRILEDDPVLKLILSFSNCRRADFQNPGLVIMKFLQGVRNAVHGSRLASTMTTIGNLKVDFACFFAVLAAIDIKTALATQMFEPKTNS